MALFSSTPQTNSDPAPWLVTAYDGTLSKRRYSGPVDTLYSGAKPPVFAPRPEYNSLPANPVLVLFRRQQTPLIPMKTHVQGMLMGLDRLLSEPGFQVAHIEHARKVLIRMRRVL